MDHFKKVILSVHVAAVSLAIHFQKGDTRSVNARVAEESRGDLVVTAVTPAPLLASPETGV